MNQHDKAVQFVALHRAPGAFVMPNPWDAGSARVLASLGFHTLATTSAGLAFALGRRARRRLGVRSEEEGLAAASVLYDAIGIEFSSRHGGSVLVPRCAFAGAYGPDVCRLMSAMDSGLIAGLTGSAGLRFTQRLTEGAVACRASVVHSGGVS